MKQAIAGLALASVGAAQAVTVLSESFNDVNTLPGSGWTQVNNSVSPVPGSWLQGNPGNFSAASGAANAYIASGFTATSANTGAISNWLILPTLTLDSSSELSFQVRNAGDGFLDKIEIRFSPNGSSTNVGATTTSVGDFTMLLGGFTASGAGSPVVEKGSFIATPDANTWIGLTFTLDNLSAPTTGRLAFRYVVSDVATAGNYLGIDDVVVTSAVPEPAAYLLMGLGVAGLLLRRRAAN